MAYSFHSVSSSRWRALSICSIPLFTAMAQAAPTAPASKLTPVAFEAQAELALMATSVRAYSKSHTLGELVENLKPGLAPKSYEFLKTKIAGAESSPLPSLRREGESVVVFNVDSHLIRFEATSLSQHKLSVNNKLLDFSGNDEPSVVWDAILSALPPGGHSFYREPVRALFASEQAFAGAIGAVGAAAEKWAAIGALGLAAEGASTIYKYCETVKHAADTCEEARGTITTEGWRQQKWDWNHKHKHKAKDHYCPDKGERFKIADDDDRDANGNFVSVVLPKLNEGLFAYTSARSELLSRWKGIDNSVCSQVFSPDGSSNLKRAKDCFEGLKDDMELLCIAVPSSALKLDHEDVPSIDPPPDAPSGISK